MTAPPMRRWQNGLVILAAFFVAGALLPWGFRLLCALGAIGIVLLLFVMRLRAHTVRPGRPRSDDVYGRVERIREARKGRPGRRP